MTILPYRNLLSVSLALGISTFASAQSTSVALNQPAQRDAVIAAGADFLVKWKEPIISDQGAPDPFVGKVAEAPVQVPTIEVPVVRAVIDEAELLRNLANLMSARGTAIMGEHRFLLLSQKRLKVGESITISFEGNDYEVWLVDLSSTTFTIRRRDLTHTRAVSLSR